MVLSACIPSVNNTDNMCMAPIMYIKVSAYCRNKFMTHWKSINATGTGKSASNKVSGPRQETGGVTLGLAQGNFH